MKRLGIPSLFCIFMKSNVNPFKIITVEQNFNNYSIKNQKA